MDNFVAHLKIFFILLAIMGCGNNFTPISGNENSGSMQSVKPIGTCDRKFVSMINLCTEMIGTDYNDTGYLGVLQSNCEATGGFFSTMNCDSAGSIGTCVVDRGQSNEVFTIYYPPLYSATNAQIDCDSHGGEFQNN